MTRLITDGAEMGDSKGFDFGTSEIQGSARSGNYRYSTGQGSHTGYNIPGSPTEIYLRFAHAPGNTTNGQLYVSFQDSATNQSDFIRINMTMVNNTYVIQINNSSVATIASPAQFIGGQWRLVEIYVKIHATEGIVAIKENGILLGQYDGNTEINGTQINSISFYNVSWGAGILDDIAINNTVGTEDNSWCGDGHIILYKPNASGSTTMLMGSDEDQTDNYALVDDIPSDGDTTYVYSGSPGYYDLYKLENTALPVNSVIKRVWVESRAKDPDTGYLKSVIQTASGSYTSGSVQLTTAYAAQKYDEYTTNPSTGSGWTSDEIDYLQAGIQIAE